MIGSDRRDMVLVRKTRMFGLTRAPDLVGPEQLWFNVERPLSLADLRGKLVILDFWTFCCVNCLHTLPTLAALEARFPDEVVVIGVHCPKFDHERDPRMVAQAIARHGIGHPVVHDPDLRLWDAYCVHAWPTLVLIAPDGRVIGQLSGEPHPDLLPEGIAEMVDRFAAQGRLRPGARHRPPAALAEPGRRLRFPAKIRRGLAGTWVVADCGHHQVVLFGDDGCERARFGGGEAGWRDGADPLFNGPEGVASDGRHLYVADTRNHVIRRLDPGSGETVTLAGQGWRGGTLGAAVPGPEVALASPWDVEVAGENLYFANAGSHQLGRLDLRSGMVSALAGCGAESLQDGVGTGCVLAQPSGLALCDDGDALYFADAESSALRRLCLDSHRVETLVGHGLFDFGHRNGPVAEARLQHPLALAVAGGRIFVADSYNQAVRVVDPVSGQVSDLGAMTDAVGLGEPAGVATDGPWRLLLSDTNNHRILEMDLRAGTIRPWVV